MEKEKSYRKIESVTKAIEILNFISTQKTAVGAPEIARAVCIPTGTVMCHMVTLKSADFVTEFAFNKFCIGAALAGIWSRQLSLLGMQREGITNEIKRLGGE
jgi:DNA-binding IclR family transcriptional regulator